VPRAPWRRRITSDSRVAFDSPRPGGRRWHGIRRGSSNLARQVLRVRVGRRSRVALVHPDSHSIDPLAVREIQAIAPVSPAVGPSEAAPTAGMAIPLLPGERTLARRAKFALVNGCTLASLGLGLGAIFLAMAGDVRIAAAFLVACVVFDGLDGILARRLGVASPFGAQMDSLADMCSFGLAAPVVVYASLHGTVSTAAAAVACALVAGCAAIRLARFNVSPKDGRFFCGVPTTMAAAVLALAVLIGLPVSGTVVVAGVAILAFTMVSSFPYAKLARLVKLPPWLLLVPVIGGLLDIRVTFFAIVVAYLASGPLLWLRQRRTA
jgi:CDP-diacylglycerol---serine O-phosphatidyltransferase